MAELVQDHIELGNLLYRIRRETTDPAILPVINEAIAKNCEIIGTADRGGYGRE
jgi:hypothetical protein